MDFTVSHRFHGGLAIVTVTGEVDVFTSPKLRESLLAVIEDGGRHLIVDLSGVEFLDSTGLGVLVGIFHRLQSHDGSMTFAGAGERLLRVFHITRLNKIFVMYPTLHDALEAHVAGAPAPGPPSPE